MKQEGEIGGKKKLESNMLRQLATLMQIRFTYQMLVGSAPKPKNRRFHNCFPGSVPSSLAADCSCEEHLEIIDHLESGCGRLAPIENLQRYDRTTHTLVNMSRVQCHSQKELVATESPYIVQKKKRVSYSVISKLAKSREIDQI